MDATRAPLPGTHPVLPGIQAPLPGNVAVIIGLVALLVVMIPFFWPLAEHFSTMAHEGAHAACGSLLGFSPQSVKLDGDGTGVTSFLRPLLGVSAVIVGVIGYLGPSVYGLFAAKLIETGHVVAVLWVAVIFLVSLLFLIKKSFGVISVPIAIGLLALVMRYASEGLEEVIAYAVAWLLLLSGVRATWADGAQATDAGLLSKMTPFPRGCWALLWLAGTLMAVVIGGKWLVLRS